MSFDHVRVKIKIRRVIENKNLATNGIGARSESSFDFRQFSQVNSLIAELLEALITDSGKLSCLHADQYFLPHLNFVMLSVWMVGVFESRNVKYPSKLRTGDVQ